MKHLELYKLNYNVYIDFEQLMLNEAIKVEFKLVSGPNYANIKDIDVA